MLGQEATAVPGHEANSVPGHEATAVPGQLESSTEQAGRVQPKIPQVVADA